MGKVIRIPTLKPEPYTVNTGLAVLGYWVSCHRCKRECFRAGKNFIACTAHSEHDTNNKSWSKYLHAKEG